MDRLGIRRAAVPLLDGVLLKDAGIANAELHQLIGERRGAVLPGLHAQPYLPRRAEQLDRCRQEYGLAPGQRGRCDCIPASSATRSTTPAWPRCCASFVAWTCRCVLTLQLEDSRIHHPAIQVPDPDQSRGRPGEPVAGSALDPGRRTPSGGAGDRHRLRREARAWFDIARVQGPMDCIRAPPRRRSACTACCSAPTSPSSCPSPQSWSWAMPDCRSPKTPTCATATRRRRWASGEAGCPHLGLGEKRPSHGSRHVSCSVCFALRPLVAGHGVAQPFRKDIALSSPDVTATPARTQALSLPLRRQRLGEQAGYRVWLPDEQRVEWHPGKTALIVCDVWLRHECRGAEERLALLLPRMDELIASLRDAGVLIVHAPSGTIPVYDGQPARERVLAVPPVEPPPDLAHDDPPLPWTAPTPATRCRTTTTRSTRRACPTRTRASTTRSRSIRNATSSRPTGGSSTATSGTGASSTCWSMGVHTNMCILNRTFSIKQMVRWGMDIALVRDLTDAMYNPARAPVREPRGRHPPGRRVHREVLVPDGDQRPGTGRDSPVGMPLTANSRTWGGRALVRRSDLGRLGDGSMLRPHEGHLESAPGGSPRRRLWLVRSAPHATVFLV